jgi:hypothetical protein
MGPIYSPPPPGSPQMPAKSEGSSKFEFQTGTAGQESKASSDTLYGGLRAAIDRLGQAVRGQGPLFGNFDAALAVSARLRGR